jgi:hypothetical protein
MQAQESQFSRERFINSIGNRIFIKGRGAQGARDLQAEAQWNLIEAIRQGRQDMMDIGQGAGKPGYSYKNENTRDPGRGMPPDLALTLRVAQEKASTMNPRVKSYKRASSHMQSTPFKEIATSGIGTYKDGDITDNGIGYRTSDYQAEHYYPPNIPEQYTRTKVADVNAARANYESNVNALDGTAAENYQRNAKKLKLS